MLIQKLRAKLLTLRLKNGGYIASTGSHYRKMWMRDTALEVLPELLANPELYKQTFQTLLDYYIKAQETYNKFYWLIVKKGENTYPYEYPHPRCDENLNEIPEEWGFIQMDVFGEFLYGLYLGESAGIKILRGHKDSWIVTLIIDFLKSVKYWEVEDNAIWEENRELHASSIGACVAGLAGIRLLGFEVPQWVIDKGYETLNKILPNESYTKDCDLALMTLIYPYNILDPQTSRTVLKNVEDKLLRERGVIRYKGDVYYYKDGKEAEWCFGIGYLSLCYSQLGEFDKARYYRDLMIDKCLVNDDDIPELFFGGTDEPNPNTPLGWSLAVAILALENNI